MELKEFISESIKQITDGLIDGHDYLKSKSPNSEGIEKGYRRINFDIAVQSSENNNDSIGGKIMVAQILNFGVKNENNSSTSTQIEFNLMF
jgi:hypothetical protein